VATGRAADTGGGRLLWLLPLGALITLWGYFGAWVPHKAAGLVIPGLDLAEYVKFLPAYRAGTLGIWREGFYLPLVAASLTLSLVAFRLPVGQGGQAGQASQGGRGWAVGRWLLRLALVLLAMVAALNLLPPAWSPPLLLTPEFRLQSGVMVLLLGLALLSPLPALLPRALLALAVAGAALAALLLPLLQFLRVRPAIEALYGHGLPLGWGVYATAAGLLLLTATSLALLRPRSRKRPS
jgi:hypothetical protein